MKGTRAKLSVDFLLLAGLVCALSVFLCLVLYRGDNKYRADSPAGQNGVLSLQEWDFNSGRPAFLISGWAYYGGKLLTPEDLPDSKPGQSVFIGQYGGFEAGDRAAAPHGSASYRLQVLLPDELRSYTLELPEIFSAYRAYVNGEPVMSMGDPEPVSYRMETGNRTVTFQAGGEADILIAVSDYSHLYSGLVYPPAFGTPEALDRLLYSRFLFRAALCICALTIGLLALLIGVLNRRAMPAALYGFLCVIFVSYAGYPVFLTLGGGNPFTYAVERFSFCIILLLVAVLVRHLCGSERRWELAFPVFGVAVCLASLLLAIPLSAGSLAAMRGYSMLITLYEWVMAGYLLYLVVRAAWENTAHNRPILCGAVAFATALVMDRVLPLHEPIITGWFVELASFVLILSVGASIGLEVSAQYRDKAVLGERLGGAERLLALQKTHHELLQKEAEETKALRHDMRHHFHMMDGFVKRRAYDELERYIASFGDTLPERGQTVYAANHVIDVLAQHYAYLARQNTIDFDFRCDAGIRVGISDAELCGLLSNLLENAVEACLRVEEEKRVIQVAVAQMGAMFSIHIENAAGNGLRPSGQTFLSTKGTERTGYGLASVAATARRYDWSAKFVWNRDTRMFTSHVTLMTVQ